MCGIVGYWGAFADPSVVERMATTIASRGPDGAGVWSDNDADVALGHRRLSILDLSPAGYQPMHSPCGRYVLVFNGEIYNHRELRSDLEKAGGGFNWRGHSDTETLLAGLRYWGIERCLKRLNGMFAFALWDRHERRLSLARDRFGEKPLYFGYTGQGAQRAFVFGSELKALRVYPGFDNKISRRALAHYLRFMVVPAPCSIFEGIHKLEQGCLLSLRSSPTEDLEPDIRRWCSFPDLVQTARRDPLTDEVEALGQLDVALSEAVRLQSLADVPLGAFLSGGVDSSLIVALMQRQSNRPVESFTVGFEDAGFDESPHARAVAKHLGTAHHELFVSAPQAREVIPLLPRLYDEPFGDFSQIPMYLVCQAARQSVKVALSGDGGDELFGGYNRYFWGPQLWQQLGWLPAALRQRLARFLQSMPPAYWDRLFGHARVQRPGEKLQKLGRALDGARGIDDLYWHLVSEWREFDALVVGLEPVVNPASETWLCDFDPVERMMIRDTLCYLPDDILCKVDRASMGVSLETRAPFLDRHVAELAWRLPLSMKLRNGKGKWALRQLLYKHVPPELIERPKAGFAIPIGQWLREPLRDWAEDLLDEQRLLSEGYLHPEPIRHAWAQHLSGRRDYTQGLWAVLMFQAWHEEHA